MRRSFRGSSTIVPSGWPIRLAGTALAAAAITLACGGDDPPGATTGGGPGEPAAPARTADTGSSDDVIERERRAVADAHMAAMQARIDSAAAPVPDADHPALDETHTDPMLTEWRGQLRSWAHTGHAVRYPDDSELEVEVLDVSFSWDVDGGTGPGDAGPDDVGNLATLQACIVDDGDRFDVATGRAINDGEPGEPVTILELATLRKVDGEWKLAERQAQADWPGRAGCAAE